MTVSVPCVTVLACGCDRMGVTEGISTFEGICFVAMRLTLLGEQCRDIRTWVTHTGDSNKNGDGNGVSD